MFIRFHTNLDRAIALSIVAMVAFNLAVLGSQTGTVPQVAQASAAHHGPAAL